MTVQEILDCLEISVPLAFSESWDRNGFQLGSPQAHVSSVACALDATVSSVTEALARGCQLLMTHHPLFFHSLTDLDLSRSVPRVCEAALKGDLAIASWHTCWDVARGGVNEGLLKRAGLHRIRSFTDSEELLRFGLGGAGSWDVAMTMEEATRFLARQWGLSGWQFWGDSKAECATIAVCGGAGGEFWPHAIEQNAQLYITAEMKHHQILEALDQGLHLMVCDHGEMEEPSMADLAVRVQDLCGISTTLIPSPVKHKLQWFSSSCQ